MTADTATQSENCMRDIRVCDLKIEKKFKALNDLHYVLYKLCIQNDMSWTGICRMKKKYALTKRTRTE